jgi:hypothetical protein
MSYDNTQSFTINATDYIDGNQKVLFAVLIHSIIDNPYLFFKILT